MRNRLIIGSIVVLVAVAAGWWFFNARQLTTGATFSRSGEQIAFIYWGGGGRGYDLYVQAIDAETPVQLTKGFRVDTVQWLPDGNRVSFLEVNAHRLYTLDVTTGELSRIRDNVFGYEWSPDGTQLAWREQVGDENAELLIGDVAADDFHAIEPEGVTFSWSPDGRHLAYIASYPDDDESRNEDITIAAADGSDSRRISLAGTQSFPDWSPDGRYLRFFDVVYDEAYGGVRGHNIMIYDLDTDTVIDLENSVGRNVFPDWSQDSQHLLFQQDDTGHICAVALTGVVGDCYERGESAVWNTDETLIAYHSRETLGELCITSLNVAAHGRSRCFFDWERWLVPVAWRP